MNRVMNSYSYKRPLDEKVKTEVHKYSILAQDTDWRREIKEYLNDPSRGKVPAKVRLEATKYFLMGSKLYSKDPQGLLLRIPESIIVDQASIFIGHEFNSYLKGFEIQKIHSTPYFAQANGQAEATNKVISKGIAKMVDENPKNWHVLLHYATWAY
uniref:Integrase catalytic domain-containing protein n=1 Tax=Chenopodium quinoa TaxID=63459 RepID=A0A803M292_CHEQI